MSNIPYSSLKSLYRELADDFIEDINATPVTLYFKPLLTSATNVNVNGVSYDVFGNPVPSAALLEPNVSGVLQAEIPVTEQITARIYWAPKDFRPPDSLNIKDVNDICKMNTYATHSAKLSGAMYSLINGKRCALIREPVPYGIMGEKFYCCSYWQVIV